MDAPDPGFTQLFYELFGSLPRQGPGNRACAARALAMCRELQPSPQVLDIGCGAGGQTLQLAELTEATIVAVDAYAPGIARLEQSITRLGLAHRVRALVGDMANLDLPPASFDLVWSEGALYNLGLTKALRVCRGLLRSGGYLAFTDAVWRKRKQDIPPEVRAAFESDYPTMGQVEDLLALVAGAGFDLCGHFTLPDEAWWDDFYAPMERRLGELRALHADDPDAMAVIDELAREPEMHRRHADCYAYEFIVARRGA
ncbi:MAG: methyltransferase domain-containing protein [bacterium]|nr:methyltransferase domain-containing protein [bacterium]